MRPKVTHLVRELGELMDQEVDKLFLLRSEKVIPFKLSFCSDKRIYGRLCSVLLCKNAHTTRETQCVRTLYIVQSSTLVAQDKHHPVAPDLQFVLRDDRLLFGSMKSLPFLISKIPSSTGERWCGPRRASRNGGTASAT